jgi:UPF0716 protein FxsA
VLLLLVFVYGAAELAAFVVVAEQIGLLGALALLVAVSALGPAIVRRVGLSVMAHTRARLDRGEAPTGELLDGLVVLFGGLLICVPGFIGDAVGLALMLRPLRRVLLHLGGAWLAKRVRRAQGRRWIVDVRSRPGPPDDGGATRPPGPSLPP